MDSPEATLDDEKIVTLWRSVLTQALFDYLRGPTVDARPPPRRKHKKGRASQSYLEKKKLYDNVILPRARAIHRDVVHWVFGGTEAFDYIEETGEFVETPSDFVYVCELACLDPAFVKTTFIRLAETKKEAITRYDQDSKGSEG